MLEIASQTNYNIWRGNITSISLVFLKWVSKYGIKYVFKFSFLHEISIREIWFNLVDLTNRDERKTQVLEPFPSTSHTSEVDHVDSINDASFDFLKDIEEDKEIYRLKV